jgi:predicted protein tyrosine phosphatase
VSKDSWPKEKNWKSIPTRSQKVERARQLGFEYPRDEDSENTGAPQPNEGPLNVLFVCSRNQWRSPTAEQVFRKHSMLNVRSGGTSPKAKHTVNESDIRWAHVVLVMESKHRTRLQAQFARLLEHKSILVLEIPDEYQYMDPELVTVLTQAVTQALGLSE